MFKIILPSICDQFWMLRLSIRYTQCKIQILIIFSESLRRSKNNKKMQLSRSGGDTNFMIFSFVLRYLSINFRRRLSHLKSIKKDHNWTSGGWKCINRYIISSRDSIAWNHFRAFLYHFSEFRHLPKSGILRISALAEIRHSPNFGAYRNSVFPNFGVCRNLALLLFFQIMPVGRFSMHSPNTTRPTQTQIALKSLRILDQVLSNYSAAQLDPLSSKRTLRPCFQARETPKGRTGFYTRNS